MSHQEFRVGQGIDIHPFQQGRELMLGGVQIPFASGLAGHSDADVLLHALIDALLGAAGKGDIGTHFPDTDQTWKDADSRELLANVWQQLKKESWQIVNLDSTLMAEAPRLNPHVPAMQDVICGVLGIERGRCSIKATTAERLGFIGRGEGIMATCVVLLERTL